MGWAILGAGAVTSAFVMYCCCTAAGRADRAAEHFAEQREGKEHFPHAGQ
ncbi:MAG: hypothetical protein IJP98_00880 [Clostridia bacterium]|nr:hypothetical protein [Clostridia bacterium]